jgi:methyltransferase (TIGR00027 family)
VIDPSGGVVMPTLPEPVQPGASRTALASLQAQALHERDRTEGLAARLYMVAATHGREHLAAASDPDAYRAAVRAGVLLGPGYVGRVAKRKRWMADAAAAAISAGIREVAVLGAGFDTLGLELVRPDLLVVELDRPATVEAKQLALSTAGIAEPWPRFVAVDLGDADALESALAGAGWRSSDPTIFIAEVVLEYLAPEAALAVLSAVATRAAPGSRLACTLRLGDVADDRVAAVTAEAGEPMRFRPLAAEVPDLLAEAGLSVVAERGGIIGSRGAAALLVLERRSGLV